METYRDLVIALIDKAKGDEALRDTLQNGSPDEVVAALEAEGFTTADIRNALADFKAIANVSFGFWNW